MPFEALILAALQLAQQLVQARQASSSCVKHHSQHDRQRLSKRTLCRAGATHATLAHPAGAARASQPVVVNPWPAPLPQQTAT